MNLIDVKFFGETQYFNLKDRASVLLKSPGFNKFKFAKGN